MLCGMIWFGQVWSVSFSVEQLNRGDVTKAEEKHKSHKETREEGRGVECLQ